MDKPIELLKAASGSVINKCILLFLNGTVCSGHIGKMDSAVLYPSALSDKKEIFKESTVRPTGLCRARKQRWEAFDLFAWGYLAQKMNSKSAGEESGPGQTGAEIQSAVKARLSGLTWVLPW